MYERSKILGSLHTNRYNENWT